MKKYQYKYCVFTNNLRDGVIFLCACDTLPQALNKREYLQYSGWGCCDIVKKRFIAGELFPLNESICDNYRYSEYDL